MTSYLGEKKSNRLCSKMASTFDDTQNWYNALMGAFTPIIQNIGDNIQSVVAPQPEPYLEQRMIESSPIEAQGRTFPCAVLTENVINLNPDGQEPLEDASIYNTYDRNALLNVLSDAKRGQCATEPIAVQFRQVFVSTINGTDQTVEVDNVAVIEPPREEHVVEECPECPWCPACPARQECPACEECQECQECQECPARQDCQACPACQECQECPPSADDGDSACPACPERSTSGEAACDAKDETKDGPWKPIGITMIVLFVLALLYMLFGDKITDMFKGSAMPAP